MSSLLLWCNCSYGGSPSSFYQLNNNCTDHDINKKEYYWTAGLNFALFSFCLMSGIIITFKYNSIHVLNLRYRPTSISNVLWVLYFTCVGIRSLILALFYVLGSEAFKYHKHVFPNVLFPTENVFRISEILFLALTLEYQRKHRSKGFIGDVIENFNQSSYEFSKRSLKYVCQKVFCSTYTVFIVQALISLALLAATSVFILRDEESSKTLAVLYWTYNGCVWTLGISCIVLTLIIMCASTIDEDSENKGPSKSTKVLLVLGVGLSLPADLPVFIWQNCILKEPIVSGYYIVVPLMLVAVICFMAVLINEFIRLKEEAQWSVIDQTESQYSITESM